MRYLSCLLVALFCCSTLAKEAKYVRVTDGAHPYVIELIELALSYQSTPYKLQYIKNIPTQSRAIRLLGKDNGIDIFWSVTSFERENIARAIRVPIVKGLLGYRILLIDQSQQHRFSNLSHISQLQSFHYGLRHDWPDHDIFVDNKLSVNAFHALPGALNMLTSKRFDAIPISILELPDILKTYNAFAEQQLLLYYPSAVYFFVDKQDNALYSVLQEGLNKALKDGSFEQLFSRHFAKLVEELSLEQRTLIELRNRSLPPSAPLNNSQLWYKKQNDKS
ncbi:transporter substrate-binding domain-containing protein [Pseudoalteromonas luteoviolacea]|uniref:transporter substrate-binding domain-containing protein n=1 Tax=Pseudoalteromonas luteoviolacea TaxID=43657 RepID=UPI001B382CB1|nr:transporter substrate-binding domain-containing protein [Pseudoalteromonas luteoviolacea]MBQ4836443.1 transporter substrate-binding domain-containing protein [Pseudoalteromonas luteoviolacea]